MFNVEYSDSVINSKANLSPTSLDKSYNETVSDFKSTYSPSYSYIACLKANFDGFIGVSSRSLHSSQNLSEDSQNLPDSELSKSIRPADIECNLTMSANEDSKTLSLSAPISKSISNSTGFLNSINDTQVQDGMNPDASERSVNSSDINSDCDFIVTTAYFSKIKCMNSSIEYIKECTNTKPNMLEHNLSPVVSPSTFLSSKEERVRQSPKGNSSDIKRLVSEVLSLLNKEPIMDFFQINVTLCNKLSTKMVMERSNSSPNSLFLKTACLTSINDESTSPKKVSEYVSSTLSIKRGISIFNDMSSEKKIAIILFL